MSERLEQEQTPVFAIFAYPRHARFYDNSGEFLQMIFGTYDANFFISEYTAKYNKLHPEYRNVCAGGTTIWHCINANEETPALLPVESWTILSGQLLIPTNGHNISIVEAGGERYALSRPFPDAAPDTPISIIGVFERPALPDLQEWTQLSLYEEQHPLITVYFAQVGDSTEVWELVEPGNPDIFERPAWVYSGNPALLDDLLADEDVRNEVQQFAHVLIEGRWDVSDAQQPDLTEVRAVYTLRDLADQAAGYQCFVNISIDGAECSDSDE